VAAFKNWLRGSKEPSEGELTIDDLVTLERYEDARDALNDQLKKHPHDLHAHLKLAEVYQELGDADSCKAEFQYVVAAYAKDGFYDKSRAILSKLSRLFPGEIDVELKMAALQRAKRLDYDRGKAREGLLSHSRMDDPTTGKMALEFERIWNELSKTLVVDRVSSQDFSRLFSAVKIIKPDNGQQLAEKGSSDRQLFLVVTGLVEARDRDPNDHLITLRSFGPGDIVGDTTLFQGRPWAADYYSTSLATVLQLDRQGLEELIKGQSDPKGLLDVLRDQGNDAKVERAVQHLRK
jgi:CRP-like cAMP-binding protein